MNILVGCEESQVVTKTFRKAGFEAFSCDLEPTRGNPAWHFQQDIMGILPVISWDLIILHPDCTTMAVSGNRWYGKNMPMNHRRITAVEWTLNLWKLAKKHSKKVVLENPKSVIFPKLKISGQCKTVQYIQPWMFGHGETKETGLALHNLPKLIPTNEVEGREQRIWKMPPSSTRKRDRSVTFQGIADAMVQQWGTLL